MNAARALWAAIEGNPRTMQRLHGVLTLAWLAIGLFGLTPAGTIIRESIPALFFISVYANAVGHWSSRQAAKVEVKQDEAS